MDLKYVCQQYFTCMCFLGFIRYNKTFIACRLRKNENWFSHEYHIPLGSCPQGIWYSCVNKFSYFPHQHAINVYYYTSYINYHKYINLIRQWVKIRTRDHTGQNHIPWNKNHIPPRRKPRGFSRQSYRSLTGKCQKHSECMWLLNVWDNVPLDLKYVCQQYFKCMCFLGFIRYNKTFIACRLRKNGNWFSHEYHIPLGSCPQGIWYSYVNKFSYFPHQHAINV